MFITKRDLLTILVMQIVWLLFFFPTRHIEPTFDFSDYKFELNINEANKKDFMLLPGIGNSTAEKIVRKRSELGGFTNVNQLHEIKGIGPKMYKNISEMIYIPDEPDIREPAFYSDAPHLD